MDANQLNELATVNEAMDREIAGEQYAMLIDDSNGRRESERGRLFPNERKAFDAGWDAAKAYYGARR